MYFLYSISPANYNHSQLKVLIKFHRGFFMSLWFSFFLLSTSLMLASCLLIYISPSKMMLLGISTYLMVVSIILMGVIIQKCLKPINALIQHINKSLSKSTTPPSLLHYKRKNEMQLLKYAVFDLTKQFHHLKNELSITREIHKQREIELSTIISSSKICEQKIATKMSKIEDMSYKAFDVSNHAQHILYKLIQYFSDVTEAVDIHSSPKTFSISSISDVFTNLIQLIEHVIIITSDTYKQLEQNIKSVTHTITSIEHATISISSLQHITTLLNKKIEDVFFKLTFIDKIANQTNILAVNLTMEAAKMGTPGKGFSIIASEVKKLAQQSISATKKIEQTIYAIQTQTDHFNTVVKKITKYTTASLNHSVKSGKSMLIVVTTIQNTLKKLSSLSDTIKETSKSIISHQTVDKQFELTSTYSIEHINTTLNSLVELSKILKELNGMLKPIHSKHEITVHDQIQPLPMATNNTTLI